MEHEITGHSRKAYRIWKNHDLSPWKKFKEIGTEIIIIVFAVSLAAFLERQREHSAEQKLAKEFLVGLKTDLQNDIREMEQDRASYVKTGYIFAYLMKTPMGTPINRDSVIKYEPYLFNTVSLVPNDGRYQGFKSSGKISSIENTGLQNDILDLYQENIPSLLLSTNSFTQRKQLLFEYLLEHMQIDKGVDNIVSVLSMNKPHNLSFTLSSTGEIVSRYDTVINKSRKIIAAIDKEYH
jgi:hypothetical protein